MTKSTGKISPPPSGNARAGGSRLLLIGAAVLAWFALAEVAAHLWYSSREAGLPRNQLPASGEIVVERLLEFLQENGTTAHRKAIDEVAMGTLKASFGETVTWQRDGGFAAVTTLKWDERFTVGGAESMHNPGKCLRATGWTIGARTDFGSEEYCQSSCEVAQWEISRSGLRMLAFTAVFGRFAESAGEGGTAILERSRDRRLRSVIQGRRDAPVFIILAYLPIPSVGGVDAVHRQFQEILRAIFCDPVAGASAD